MISSFLDQKFRKNAWIPMAKLIEPIKHGTMMRAGTLVVMASGDRKLRLRLLEKDTPHKGFSEPLLLNSYAGEHSVTPTYLLWYLSHAPVRDYLLSHITGSVIWRVSRKTLHAPPIPLPTRLVKVKEVDEVVLEKAGDTFSNLIGAFYKDYLLNFSSGRFRTAIILAGAISEVILYQLRLEQDINPKIRSHDRNLGLGKMLDDVRLLKLDQSVTFPMTHLMEIQKNRNSAIHAGLIISSQREFSREDLLTCPLLR
jgi:hypothetical protein